MNLFAPLAVGALSGGTLNGTYAILDSKKGSLTNRFECAKEHVKNDMKYTASLAIPGAAITYAAIKKPELLSSAASTVGKFAVMLGKKIAKSFPTLGLKDVKVLKDLAKNPKKLGKIGLIAAGALYLVDRIAKYANKKGRIDQKYEDAAKIESQTKNVVLEDRKVCTPKEIQEFYKHGGKGVRFDV